MRKLFALMLVAGLLLVSQLPVSGTSSPVPESPGKWPLIMPLNPHVVQQLRAQGKSVPNPFPNSANRGRKFDPGGSAIPPLQTDARQKVLVLFVDFLDAPPGGPTTRLDLSYFDDMLFGTVYDPPEYAPYGPHPTDRTLKNFFADNSYGAIDVVTLNMPSTTGWMHAGHTYSYYCNNDNGLGVYPNNAQGLVVDAIKLADASIDFSQYAVNGVVPNLFVVHAGTGAEWNSDPQLIWSHSWDLSTGTGLPAQGYQVDGVWINNYAMMPEVGGDTTGYYSESGPYPPTVGVYAHEYGHVLGLPDQYDYGYESEGTGQFSAMALGSWNWWPLDEIFIGNSPANLDAWSKYRLGLIVPQEVSSPIQATLPPAELDPIVYKITVPNSGGKEYFLFENRQNIGFDQGLWAVARGPDGQNVLQMEHGMLVYHVDDTVLNRNYWLPNEAENWKEFRSEGWRKAETGETHYGISVVQADDQWGLEHGSEAYGGDASDPYPGTMNVTALSSYTRPNTSSYYFWAGSAPKFGYSGATVTDITEHAEQDGTITAKMSIVPWTPR